MRHDQVMLCQPVMPVHPAGLGTAADRFTRRLLTRVPGWNVTVDGLRWLAVEPDPGRGRWVLVDELSRSPGLEGLLIAGSARGRETRINVNPAADAYALHGPFTALVAMGVLPTPQEALNARRH